MRGSRYRSISLVIPAFNEEGRISSTLDELIRYLDEQDFDWEIIVVDDGSRDRTSFHLKDFARRIPRIRILRNERNTGKGFAVRQGVLTASKAHILYSDADLAVPPPEIEKLLRKIENEEFDIAVGSRAIPGSVVIGQPLYRRFMGRVLNLLVRCLLVKGIKDTQCGFKCFRREVARDLFTKQKMNGFSFEIEVLHLARKRGYRISEVPVTWIHHPGSKVNPLRDALTIFRDLLKLSLQG